MTRNGLSKHMTKNDAAAIIPSRTIIQTDCLCLLERFPNRFAKLVYLDPPWCTRDSAAHPASKGKRAQSSVSAHPQTAEFSEYIGWIERVIQQAHRVGTHDGNIVVHVDPPIEGYLRLIINELLPGAEISRISLAAPHMTSRRASPVDNQNSLLLVRKSADSTWYPPTRPMTKGDIQKRYAKTDSDGRRYLLADITTPAPSTHTGEWKGIKPPSGRRWRFSIKRLDQLHQEGRLSMSPGAGMPRLKVYADEQAGIPVGMNWSDISLLTPSKERTKYVEHQPLALLERLIHATTDAGDVVIDPMCGAGTALVVAEMLGRRWIGGDSSPEAVEVARSRIEALLDAPLATPVDINSLPVVRDSISLPRSTICSEQMFRFLLNKPIPLEETRHYEFKEVKGTNPVGAIKNSADEYAVAFLNSEGGRVLWGVRNEDRLAIGVVLTYRDRDEVAKAVDNKLCQIQPPLPPSSWRVDFFPVYDGDSAVQDLWVVQLVVPRPSGRKALYGTGSGDVFVKTSSGKKKLSFGEMQAEVIRRYERPD
jgi:hypothetical protein